MKSPGTYKTSVKPALYGGKPMFSKIIPITVPTIPSSRKLQDRYLKVLKSGMITNADNVIEFEKKTASYLKVKHAVAVSSCTTGLMLVLKGLNLKGEVILPSFTFHATAHAAIWNGLKPIFVDCGARNFTIDPGKAEKAINRNTSAIIGVHIFGNPALIYELENIAKKHSLALIFDAAHGFGSRYQNESIGGNGCAEVFSLSPTKLITSGEGGIVATNDGGLANKIRIGRNYGDPGNYNSEFSGFNARMDEFSAILGIESLAMLEENVKKRNFLANAYHKFLCGIDGISFQEIQEGNRSSYKDFSIIIERDSFGMDRNRLGEFMQSENIVTKKYFYPPVHLQKAFKELSPLTDDFRETVRISESVLSLPLYSHMSLEEVEKICLAIRRIYNYGKNSG